MDEAPSSPPFVEAPGERPPEPVPELEAEVSSLRPGDSPPRRAELGGPRLSSRQRLLRVGVPVALLAVVLLALTAPAYGPVLRALLTPHTPPPLVIHVARDGLGCVRDVAWSPDGRTLAVAGSNLGCGNGGYLPGQINLYDARSGRLLARLHPDGAVLATLHAALPAIPLAPSIGDPDLLFSYGAALWSPDGRSLAVTLFAVPNPRSASASEDGLLLLDRDGTHPRVLLRAASIGAGAPSNVIAWDLLRGQPVLGDPPAEAAAYVWSSGGMLAAIGVLGHDLRDVAAAPTGPVGNPDGSEGFTGWQPGELDQTAPLAVDSTPLPEPYLWSTLFAAWSPDGRYLSIAPHIQALVVPLAQGGAQADSIQAGASLSTAGATTGATPTATPPPGALQPNFPYIRARDAAMSDLARTPLPNSNGGWALAWRPDGRMLAAFGPRSGSTPPITLYDTATGRRLRTLAAVRDAGQLVAGPRDILRWSADGQRLLLYSTIFGTICLWGPNQLPA